MDMAPALLIFTPIFLPIVTALGMTPVQFGVMIVMNLSVGTITPPVGNVLFIRVQCGKAGGGRRVKTTLCRSSRQSLRRLLFITYVPAFSLWLPSILGLLD